MWQSQTRGNEKHQYYQNKHYDKWHGPQVFLHGSIPITAFTDPLSQPEQISLYVGTATWDKETGRKHSAERWFGAYTINCNLGRGVWTFKLKTFSSKFGNNDCGIFAIAFTLYLALGDDLQHILFEQSQMQPHLLKCFQRKKMEPFPHK